MDLSGRGRTDLLTDRTLGTVACSRLCNQQLENIGLLDQFELVLKSKSSDRLNKKLAERIG